MSEQPTRDLIPPREIDRLTAAAAQCKRCENQGLRCIAWRDGAGVYHCATLCPTCGREEEFQP